MLLFNLLVMEEDEELERGMMGLSPSKFDTEGGRLILIQLRRETYTNKFFKVHHM